MITRAGKPKRLLAIARPEDAFEVRESANALGAYVETADSLASGLARAREGWDVVLLSLSVEHADARAAALLAAQRGVAALVLTVESATLELSVEARRAGAAAVLTEPLDREALSGELRRLLSSTSAVAIPELSHAPDGAILGSSPAIARVFDVIARVAESSATVLVTGESGTGKELVARSLHHASRRRGRPFVAVNCAALPEHLLESELFGHERGAFTGAVSQRLGRFERADSGTLFLDEIGDMSLVLQAKILRALEEHEIERLGGAKPVPVDVRVVAATNRALGERIAGGEFREDLYYRLAVVTLELPPLRERGDDLEPLALHFAGFFARAYERPVRRISVEALRKLRAHAWPGNVRELRNVLDRAVLLCRGNTVMAEDLRLGNDAPRASPRGAEEWAGYPPSLSLAEVEARHIRRVLAHSGGHLGEAARVLGIHRNTLTRKVQEYGVPGVGGGR
jgi:DNA-binding NtrC family response regulator